MGFNSAFKGLKNAKAPGEFTYKGLVHVISRFTNKILE
jgi:hypothetical protein